MKKPVILDGDGSNQDERYIERLRRSDIERMKFLTIKEVCEILKVSRLTVIRWVRAGKLPAFKPGKGRGWRIRRADFDEFVGVKNGRL
jgi:excisionase family DNA binding protein